MSIVRALNSEQLLMVWEVGAGQHPLDRALTCLAAVTDGSRDELADLSIGRRDALLLEAREAMFGRWLDGFTRCPQCAVELEMRLDAAALRAVTDRADPASEGTCRHAGYRVRFRPPSSRDIASSASCTREERRRVLLEACVLEATEDGAPVASVLLPTEVQAAVEESMAQLDPLAEIALALACSACGHKWQSFIDIPGFFWREIEAAAKRILRETHLLARAYGWSEAAILSMNAGRRRAYLEMAYA